MNYTQLKDKMGLVFWPYLRLVVLFLTGYGCLDGALLNWWPGFEPPETIRSLVGPLLLGTLLALLLLWPRLRLLADSNSRSDLRMFMFMIAVGVLGFASLCLHNYLVATLGRLAALDSPAAVDTRQPLAQYYQFNHLYQTPRYSGSTTEFESSNKGRQLNFKLYVVTPMLASPADTLRPVTVWRVLNYRDDINTSASETEKEAAYAAFLKRSQQQFEQTDAALVDFNYFERLPNTPARQAYLKAARRTGICPSDTTQALLLLEPGEELYAVRGRNSAQWALGWVLGGSVLFWLLLLIPPLMTVRVAAFQAGQYQRLVWLEWLRPRQSYWLTPLLLVTNTSLYLLMVLRTQREGESFASPDLLTWGANFGPAVMQGQWWRLLTSTFLHSGFLHLLNNMFSLWLLGELLEKPVGTSRLTLLYFAAGLGGSLASIAWHPATVSVGASGAIFGLMGAAIVLAWRRALPEDLRGLLLLLAVISGGITLLMGFLMPGIDNAAHLGGLATGAVLGLLLSPGMRRRLPYYEATTQSEPEDEEEE